MKTIEEKINEMEQRHAAEIKALRDELKEGEEKLFKDGDPLLGGMFEVFKIASAKYLNVKDMAGDSFIFDTHQQKQLKAIEDIITAAIACSYVDINAAFKEAEKLGLKF